MPIKIISKDLGKENIRDIESSLNNFLEHHGGELLNVSVDNDEIYFFIKT